MKHWKPFLYLIILVLCFQSCKNSQEKATTADEFTKDVDISHFLTQEGAFEIEIVDCMLSNGDKTECYQITTKGLIPNDHQVGPWCIDHIDDAADKGGIWFKDGKVFDVDGKFIQELPELYHDDQWALFDEDGNVNKTESLEDCTELKSARLVEKFINFCIECLPEYTTDISKTYLIPITPVKLDEPAGMAGGGPPPHGERPPGGPDNAGDRPKGPPPGGRGPRGMARGPRGIAFNGVAFDSPAPLDLILSGYTIPALDDAGGHINLDAGYHYHAATGVTKSIKQKDKHAPLIGYAMDGFGIYAELDEDGNPPQGLDECRGQFDDIRGYHYHVDNAGANNFINCFNGAVAQ